MTALYQPPQPLKLVGCKAAGIGQPKAYLEQGKVATSCCSRQDQERLSKEHKEDVRVLLLNHGVQDGYA